MMMINRRRVYGGGESGDPWAQYAVDLGLPSGTLWASGNICKDSQGNYYIGNPTDSGCYFSWGNIDGHNKGEGYSFNETNYNATAGASLTSSIAITDAEHDAAVARLGNGWHLPSYSNIYEIAFGNGVIREYTSVNGVNGVLITSKNNGNTIFLPCTGSYVRGTFNSNNGNCWSGTINGKGAAYYIGSSTSGIQMGSHTFYGARFGGFAIRPVKLPT